ncbi:SDR family oxidoreductase [uncultured Thermanaerothrix sp.]|uniref:SDR family oxidoreductase n=1 Tax=uncultured Thermanaerothrix sp. TaxID=1195149 RepID=UPI00261D0763|nr:SDR family oxidoreductase [uncultured Thermanaerothrix sp.]
MSWIQERLVLITGATDGIGKVTARELAKQGAQVVIVGRNPEKTAQVAEELRRVSDNPKVDYLIADLASQASIRQMVATFRQRYDRLHVLINNAGAYFTRREVSPDGLEMTFALNHLGYFLTTLLLLDVIKASAPARIINVSSMAHAGARLNFEDLQNERRYNGWRAYSQSKLANLYFTYELARRLEGTGVTVNALHPGFVASRFAHNNHDPIAWGFRLLQRFFAISPEEGAQTSIYLATAEEVAAISGRYFVNKRAVSSSPASQDRTAAQRLWEVSLRLCSLAEITPVTFTAVA